MTGNKEDLILSQPDAVDLTTTSIDENIAPDLIAMFDVSVVSGMRKDFWWRIISEDEETKNNAEAIM